ncbi:hypothetical protein BH11ARM1_BH11ARM1_04740 [soil metagenome]
MQCYSLEEKPPVPPLLLQYPAQLYRRWHLPTDAGARGCMARNLAYVIEEAPAWALVSDRDIWSPHENISTFNFFMKGCGFEVSDDGPLIIHFDSNEYDKLYGVLSLACYYTWTIVIVDNLNNVLCVSHDEWISLQVNDSSRETEYLEVLNYYSHDAPIH